MISDERAAFYDAMMDAPDSVEARLVFSDWLQDHGDPLGEYIRVSNELARESATTRIRQLGRRKLALERENRWPDRLFNATQVTGSLHAGCMYWHLTASAATFLEHAETFFECGPVYHLRLQAAKGQIGALSASPYLRWVINLELMSNELVPDDAASLATSANVSRLRGLDLGYNAIGGAGLEALVASPHLTNLKALDVGKNVITDDALHALAASTLLKQLTSVDFGGNEVDADAFRAITQNASPTLNRLWSDRNSNLQAEAARALAEAKHLTALEILNLVQCGLGDAGVEVLAHEAPHLQSLTILFLDDNGISARGASILAKSPYLNRISVLDITGNRVGVAARQQLKDRFGKALK